MLSDEPKNLTFLKRGEGRKPHSSQVLMLGGNRESTKSRETGARSSACWKRGGWGGKRNSKRAGGKVRGRSHNRMSNMLARGVSCKAERGREVPEVRRRVN